MTVVAMKAFRPRTRTILYRGDYLTLKFPWTIFFLRRKKVSRVGTVYHKGLIDYDFLHIGFLKEEPREGEIVYPRTPPLPHVRDCGEVCLGDYVNMSLDEQISIFWLSEFKYDFQWFWVWSLLLYDAVEEWKKGGDPPPLELLPVSLAYAAGFNR